MKIDQTLLEKYLRGDCTVAEAEAVQAWLADGSDLTDEEQQKLEAIWAQMDAARIGQKAAKRYRALAAAAVLAAVLVLAFLYRPGQQRPADAPATASAAEKVLQTAPGQKAKATLPDGTRVVLNAASEIRFAAGLKGAVRKVQLKGEAYFEVAKDASRPFVVVTAQTRARILGTSFNLDAYGTGKRQVLTVQSGLVQFSDQAHPAQTLVLAKDEEALFRDGLPFVRSRVHADDASLWIQNKFVFRNTSFSEAAVRLERGYGVEIHLEDEALRSNRFTGTFEQLPLNQLLDRMGAAIGFHYTIKGKHVAIYP